MGVKFLPQKKFLNLFSSEFLFFVNLRNNSSPYIKSLAYLYFLRFGNFLKISYLSITETVRQPNSKSRLELNSKKV